MATSDYQSGKFPEDLRQDFIRHNLGLEKLPKRGHLFNLTEPAWEYLNLKAAENGFSSVTAFLEHLDQVF